MAGDGLSDSTERREQTARQAEMRRHKRQEVERVCCELGEARRELAEAEASINPRRDRVRELEAKLEHLIHRH